MKSKQQLLKLLTTFLEKLKANSFKEAGQAFPVPKNDNFNGTHWNPLPNVRSFKVVVSDYNSLFEHFNLTKRNPPELIWKPYVNAKYNVYASRQIKRLRAMKGDPRKFFRISKALMLRSKVFRVMCINKCMKNWYKDLPFGLVMSVNRKVNELLKTESFDLKYKRVYIQKKNGEWRPLGVPTLEWRIVLQLFNNFLYIFLEDTMDPNQHGFIPNRGTLTAWRAILTKVIQAKYICEYDLKDYFNQLNLAFITEELLRHGVPKAIVYWLENLNRNTPQLTADDKVDESYYRLNAQDTKDISEGRFRWESKLYDPTRDYIAKFGIKQLEQDMIEVGMDNIFEYVQYQWAVSDSQRPTQVPNQFKGVPQGTSPGPILSLQPLNHFNTDIPSVKYADDGLLYSDKPFTPSDFKHGGAYLKYHNWVKFDGEWRTPLKFLGLIYDGTNNTLTSDTKTGKTITCSGDIQIALDLISAAHKNPRYVLEKADSSWGSWKDIFTGQFAGFIQSRLYLGSWSPEEVLQNFTFSVWQGPETSWKKSHWHDGMTLHNCGSFASASLIKILTNDGRKKSDLNLRYGSPRPNASPQKSTKPQESMSAPENA